MEEKGREEKGREEKGRDTEFKNASRSRETESRARMCICNNWLLVVLECDYHTETISFRRLSINDSIADLA